MSNRNRNIFDKIGQLIPGYKGYTERNECRNNEKKFRAEICTILQQTLLIIEENQISFVKQGLITESLNVEFLRKPINICIDKIKFKEYGESSFFSEKQIKTEELQVIYNYDEKIASYSKNLYQLITECETIDDVQMTSLNLINKINSILIERSNYIKQYK